MIYAFGDFELDTSAIELRENDNYVHLEPQVFGVLTHLIENRDRVVSKIELIDEVWPDRFVTESALTSRIRAARRACGDTGRDQNVIRTSHGRGYRFVAPLIGGERRMADKPALFTELIEPSVESASTVVRAAELAEIEDGIDDALAGRRRTMFITGDAGMGKSALVDMALERIDHSTGVRVLYCQCRAHRGTPEPYVSLLDGFTKFARQYGADALDTFEQVAPMWALQLPSLFDADRVEALRSRVIGGTGERMLREGVDLLESLARTAPLVFVLEDLHWADPHTLDVIEWTSRSRDELGLLVIATFRRSESDSNDVSRMVSEITTGHAAQLLVLEPLDATAVRAVIAERTNADHVADQLVARTLETSAGNPLFVNAAIDAWTDEQAVVVIDGTAGLSSTDRTKPLTLPDNLRQIIDQSFDLLDEEELRLLEVAAVVGREFPSFLVAAGTESANDPTERSLGAMARRGRFVSAIGADSWPDGTISTVFEITHDLHRQILYERLPAGRRAAVHAAVGERLEAGAAHSTDEHVTALAHHFESAGDTDRSIRYLRQAGEVALSRSAHVEAVDLFERSLSLLATLPVDDDRLRSELAVRASLGPALIATQGWIAEGVESNYERAIELCAMLSPASERFLIRYGLATVHELRGEYNLSEDLLVEQIADGSEFTVETQELLACSSFHQGAFEKSMTHAAEGLSAWNQEEHSLLMARYGEHPGVSCNTWAALSAWFLGQIDASMEMAERAVDWGATNTYSLATARVQFAFLHHFRREIEPCRSWAERTIELADEQGFPFRTAQATVLRGWCDAVAGDPARGMKDIDAGLKAYRALGARMDCAHFLGLWAEAELLAGDFESALTHLAEARAILSKTTRTYFFEPELRRLAATALVAQQPEEGREQANAELNAARTLAERANSVVDLLRLDITRHRLGLTDDPEGLIRIIGEHVEAIGPSCVLPDIKDGLEILDATR
jgi:DNA-binding winged helix-turn-helix (wHTH) protein/tetratricopeptide (TPR) repeat protein